MRCFTKSKPESNEAELLLIFELLESLLTKVSISEAESLWMMALFSNEKQYCQKLIDTSLIAVAKCGGIDDRFNSSEGRNSASYGYTQAICCVAPSRACFIWKLH